MGGRSVSWDGRECTTWDSRECVTWDGREGVTSDGREEGEDLPASRRAREPMKSSGGDRVSGRGCYPVRLRRCRVLTEASSSPERQRSITSMLKRHSEPTRKPGSCFARNSRYTVVGCTRRYSDSSRTVRTRGGEGAEPGFLRLSST